MTGAPVPLALAGLLLSFAAWAKANDAPASRAIFVRATRLSPAVAMVLLLALAGAEAVLGVLLFLGEAGASRPAFLLAGLLSLLSLEAFFSGRISRCGCYGPRVSQKVAWGLDAALLTALLIADQPMAWPAPMPLAAAVVAGLGAVGLALWTSRHGRWLPQPVLRAGRRLPDFLPAGGGRRLILFVSPACPLCAAWKTLVAARSQLGNFPPVALVSSSEDETDETWPVTVVERARMERMVAMLPTAILVEDGVILKKWAGLPPAEWREDIRRSRSRTTMSSSPAGG